MNLLRYWQSALVLWLIFYFAEHLKSCFLKAWFKISSDQRGFFQNERVDFILETC